MATRSVPPAGSSRESPPGSMAWSHGPRSPPWGSTASSSTVHCSPGGCTASTSASTRSAILASPAKAAGWPPFSPPAAEAVLSHLSAALLWELIDRDVSSIHVLVPGRGSRRRPGIVIHRTRELAPEHRTEWSGIPVTTVGRTLLDLAAMLPTQRLRFAVEAADRRGRLDVPALVALCDGSAGRRGAGVLRSLALEQRGAAHRTKSPPETLLPAALPRPRVAGAARQLAAARLRGRLPLARREARRRDRQLHLPPLVGAAAARPRARRRPQGQGHRGAPLHRCGDSERRPTRSSARSMPCGACGSMI